MVAMKLKILWLFLTIFRMGCVVKSQEDDFGNNAKHLPSNTKIFGGNRHINNEPATTNNENKSHKINNHHENPHMHFENDDNKNEHDRTFQNENLDSASITKSTELDASTSQFDHSTEGSGEDFSDNVTPSLSIDYEDAETADDQGALNSNTTVEDIFRNGDTEFKYPKPESESTVPKSDIIQKWLTAERENRKPSHDFYHNGTVGHKEETGDKKKHLVVPEEAQSGNDDDELEAESEKKSNASIPKISSTEAEHEEEVHSERGRKSEVVLPEEPNSSEEHEEEIHPAGENKSEVALPEDTQRENKSNTSLSEESSTEPEHEEKLHSERGSKSEVALPEDTNRENKSNHSLSEESSTEPQHEEELHSERGSKSEVVHPEEPNSSEEYEEEIHPARENKSEVALPEDTQRENKSNASLSEESSTEPEHEEKLHSERGSKSEVVVPEESSSKEQLQSAREHKSEIALPESNRQEKHDEESSTEAEHEDRENKSEVVLPEESNSQEEHEKEIHSERENKSNEEESSTDVGHKEEMNSEDENKSDVSLPEESSTEEYHQVTIHPESSADNKPNLPLPEQSNPNHQAPLQEESLNNTHHPSGEPARTEHKQIQHDLPSHEQETKMDANLNQNHNLSQTNNFRNPADIVESTSQGDNIKVVDNNSNIPMEIPKKEFIQTSPELNPVHNVHSAEENTRVVNPEATASALQSSKHLNNLGKSSRDDDSTESQISQPLTTILPTDMNNDQASRSDPDYEKGSENSAPTNNNPLTKFMNKIIEKQSSNNAESDNPHTDELLANAKDFNVTTENRMKIDDDMNIHHNLINGSVRENIIEHAVPNYSYFDGRVYTEEGAIGASLILTLKIFVNDSSLRLPQNITVEEKHDLQNTDMMLRWEGEENLYNVSTLFKIRCEDEHCSMDSIHLTLRKHPSTETFKDDDVIGEPVEVQGNNLELFKTELGTLYQNKAATILSMENGVKIYLADVEFFVAKDINIPTNQKTVKAASVLANYSTELIGGGVGILLVAGIVILVFKKLRNSNESFKPNIG